MGYQRLLSRIILFALATILTVMWELFLIPILLPKASANSVHDFVNVAQQNNLNPQNLLEKGRRLYDAGKFLEAISILEQAAQGFQSQDNPIQQATALSNISLAYKQMGLYQKALGYIKQSRELSDNQLNLSNSEDRFKISAQILDIQASLQLTLGKPLAAQDSWKQAIAIYKQINFKNGRIRSLINQSLALKALGSHRQAQKILQKLIPELDKQSFSVFKTIALRSLGDIQLYLGETDASFNTLQQSYQLAQDIKSTPQIAATSLSLGNAWYLLGNKSRSRLQSTTVFAKTAPLFYVRKPISEDVRELYQQALENYDKAIEISTSSEIKVKAQLNLLKLLIDLEEFSQAGNLSSQTQLTINKLPLSKASTQARIKLAECLLFLKQANPKNPTTWEDIAKILAKAIEQAKILDNTKLQSYGTGVLGGVYLQTQDLSNAYKLSKQAVDLAFTTQNKDIAYLWQWQLGHISLVKENRTEAINYYSQAVNNLNDLRAELLVLSPDIQFSFRDNVEPVYRQLVDLLLQPVNSLNISQKQVSKNINQSNLKKARYVIEALQLREIENYFQEACLQAKAEIIDTVVDELDTTAAVIYPIILQNRIEIILKLPNQDKFQHYTTIIPAKKVEKTLEALQYSLRQPEEINQVKKLSGDIYSWLIQPLEAKLQTSQVETLVFVLDGNFRNIPMAALYDNQAGEKEPKYLIEKYAIALTPGLQMLEPEPLQEKELNLLTAGISKQRLVGEKEFNPLENVLFELNTIKSQIPKSKQLLNQSFTDTNLEKQIHSAKYTVVHIATHGNFSSNLEETYILTWDKLLKVKDFDKLFQINQNQNSQAIQLLVLSACETANGDKRATLGLSGIAIRAGVRSTLATLWAVEDKSTAELMSQFYQELQNNKLNKAKALQKAQINLLKNNESPLIWAPYILVGNWL